MNNIQQMINIFTQFKQNPMQILGRYGIPSTMCSDPQSIIQFMMNNGKITQEHYNQAVKMADSLKNVF